MLRRVVHVALDAFAPRRCAGCEVVSADALCDACRRTLTATPLPPRRRLAHGWAVAAFEFAGPAREALHAGKFRGDREALVSLAGMAVDRLPALLTNPSGVVAVPLGARRLRQRGYNQAAVIAEEVARRRGIGVLDALGRARETPPQSARDEAARTRNVEGAFAARGPRLEGSDLWLVDDVLTTGATAAAAAAALLQHGARRVDVVVVAAVS